MATAQVEDSPSKQKEARFSTSLRDFWQQTLVVPSRSRALIVSYG
jgi:hypothetical protein